jgi:uncharacterized protein
VDAPSSPVRRADKVMSEAAAADVLSRGFSGRLATVGPDGWPYIVPLLYVWRSGEICVHNTAVRGHLRINVDHEARVCFEVDEPGHPAAFYPRLDQITLYVIAVERLTGKETVLPAVSERWPTADRTASPGARP